MYIRKVNALKNNTPEGALIIKFIKTTFVIRSFYFNIYFNIYYLYKNNVKTRFMLKILTYMQMLKEYKFK